jgi:hypothetical protein
MSFISDLVQDTRAMFQNLRENPREIFNGPGTLGALREALKYNDWKIRGINDPEKSSHDILLGGWSSGGESQRKAGRIVGSVAAAIAGGNALSGGEAAAGEGAVAGEGATEVGMGMPLAEEAGAGAAESGVASQFATEAGLDASWGANPAQTTGLETGFEGLSESAAETAAREALSETATTGLEGATESLASETATDNLLKEAASQSLENKPGIIESAMKWAGEKPINTAITYGAISQGASAALQSRAAEKKRKEAEAEREYNATIKQRMKMGNPSVGGGGVNINMRPGSRVLRRPDGSAVYPPGLIQGRMGGVRG